MAKKRSIKAVSYTHLNILFLDIELPGKDGVMVGKYIREVLEEENIFLIYISSKENYALQLFPLKIYISKIYSLLQEMCIRDSL